jgi:alkyl hydroperoxide reductase subunit AhpC
MHCRDHVMQLHHHREELESQNIQAWVLSFSDRFRVQKWKERKGITFPVLYDGERKVYQQYQLQKSFFRSWSPRNLWSYVRAFFQGEEIQGIIGDPNQLGGDFLIDPARVIQLAYYSQDPLDRPDLEMIFESASDEYI